MTPDQQVQAYLDAIRSIREGISNVSIPEDQAEHIGVLGLELMKLAESLEQHFDEAKKLQQIAEEVTGGLFLDDVLNRIYDSFSLVIPYNRMGCALLSDDRSEVTSFWGRSDANDLKMMPGFTARSAGSSLQNILDTGNPRILNDLEAYLYEHPDSVSTQLVVAEGVRSSLTCPLIAQGKPIGFLFFSSFEKNTYRGLHQGVFLRIAAQLSMLIEKSRLYQEIVDLNRELMQAQKVLEEQATHDALTLIYNRKAIEGLLQVQLSRAQRLGRGLGVIMVDVDLFKQFNDIYGHLVGDKVLQAVALSMSENLRDYNYIGRFGGEEFLIVLSEADSESSMRIAERLRCAVGGHAFPIADRQLAVTISAGVAFAESVVGVQANDLIAAADEALYDAKRQGRNRVAFRHLDA
ncbi:MAG TPA: sensor domain-containing diguanylate cyclase [Novimethylophilus sp.]|jgi:diguanylate cyclase (GGDEF)-like protein|uniref:GGDEF domain-containing protein n=1 Tax=Novimethylophilus sp. TaxID=2137426 RepID=UPI002F3E451D